MKCTSCGTPIDNTAKFCPECGSKIVLSPQCSQCGTVLDAKAKFCPKCGTAANNPSSQPTPFDQLQSHRSSPSMTGSSPCHELDYRFFDALYHGYYSAILKTLEEEVEGLHAWVQSEPKSKLIGNMDTGMKEMLNALTGSLHEIMPAETVSSVVGAVRQHTTRLLEGWKTYLDRLENTGNRVLQDLPRGIIEGMVKGAKQGFAAGTAGSLAGPIGAFAGVVKAILDGHQLAEEHERIANDYTSARTSCLERLDEMWREVYEYIHDLLAKQHGIKTSSYGQIQEMYEKFSEDLQSAENYMAEDEYEEALKCAQKAMNLCPTEIYSYMIKGIALGFLERWEELLTTMEELRGLGPVPKDQLLESYFFSGIAKAKQGDFTAAIESYRKVVRLGNEGFPNYLEANYGLARCWWRLAKRRAA